MIFKSAPVSTRIRCTRPDLILAEITIGESASASPFWKSSFPKARSRNHQHFFFRVLILPTVSGVTGFRPGGPVTVRIPRFPDDLDELAELSFLYGLLYCVFEVITVLCHVPISLVVITKQRFVLRVLSSTSE
ncbi:hypothetical protein PIB30_044256 [Stylosanthes scabra]|uniref:Uncharacterized protein n=1 Tax=Stylosanthes scabra TaxID=79078 RepID=A0ABU6ZEK0_9FABA|nr:hypothetical protein [Stylosanthes scabra]